MLGDFSPNIQQAAANFFQKLGAGSLPKLGSRVVIKQDEAQSPVQQVAEDKLELGQAAAAPQEGLP